MRTSENGHHFIEKWEGFSLKPYRDVGGLWTIGIGHLITPQQAALWRDGITEEMVQVLFNADLAKAEKAVSTLITAPMTQSQFDALVSFTFNLGAVRLRASTLRARMNRGDEEGASEQFQRWCYAGGVKVAGLLKRRIAEKEMFNE